MGCEPSTALEFVRLTEDMPGLADELTAAEYIQLYDFVERFTANELTRDGISTPQPTWHEPRR
jgi:hypothetical protein